MVLNRIKEQRHPCVVEGDKYVPCLFNRAGGGGPEDAASQTTYYIYATKTILFVREKDDR